MCFANKNRNEDSSRQQQSPAVLRYCSRAYDQSFASRRDMKTLAEANSQAAAKAARRQNEALQATFWDYRQVAIEPSGTRRLRRRQSRPNQQARQTGKIWLAAGLVAADDVAELQEK